MKTVSHTQDALILQASKAEQNHRSFVFNVSDVASLNEKPTPKKVVIRYGGYDYAMTWRKFNSMPCVYDVAIISKDKFERARR